VFLSHPADGNPDHLALYLFTHVALWDLGAELQPTLYPYLVHYAHWPTPRGYHPTDPLPPPPGLEQTNAWQVHLLFQYLRSAAPVDRARPFGLAGRRLRVHPVGVVGGAAREWQCLYFLPLPHQHGSLRPGFWPAGDVACRRAGRSGAG
jgi:hypothetical protein